jgi:hypothetical protein
MATDQLKLPDHIRAFSGHNIDADVVFFVWYPAQVIRDRDFVSMHLYRGHLTARLLRRRGTLPEEGTQQRTKPGQEQAIEYQCWFHTMFI